jgi:hypothetical protein
VVETGGGRDAEQPFIGPLWLGLDRQLEEIAERMRELTRAADRLERLLEAVVAISQERDLTAVLRRVVTTAMDLVGARYGALGVLDETGEHLKQFIAEALATAAGRSGRRGDPARARAARAPDPPARTAARR